MTQNSLKYQRNWERKNKDKRREYGRKYKLKLKIWFNNYKNTLFCIECGENHPACIVFHHRNPKEKKFNVSEWRTYAMSKRRILEEIEKCDILCANCHAKKHYIPS